MEKLKNELWNSWAKCIDAKLCVEKRLQEIYAHHRDIMTQMTNDDSKQMLADRKLIVEMTRKNYEFFNKLLEFEAELDDCFGDDAPPIKLEQVESKEIATSNVDSIDTLHTTLTPENKEIASNVDSITMNKQEEDEEEEEKPNTHPVDVEVIDNNDDDSDLPSIDCDDSVSGVFQRFNTSKQSNYRNRNIAEHLSANKPKGRFERKFEDVDTPMPDLAFVKCSDSSSEYFSVAEKRSKESKDKTKKKKKLTKVKTPKKSKTENYPVISESNAIYLNDECVIAYLSDPSEFYVAITRNNASFALCEQLKEYVSTNPIKYKNKLEAKLNTGKFCIAYSKQFDSWNRAEVLDWRMVEHDKVDVQYVDFGEYATIAFKYILPLPECFCALPKQVFRCKLASIAPVNGGAEWPIESIEYFESLTIRSDANTHFTISFLEGGENEYLVDLKPVNSSVSLFELMALSEFAKFIDDETASEVTSNGHDFMSAQISNATGIFSVSNKHATEMSLEAFCDQAPEMYKNLEESLMGYNAQDERRLCRLPIEPSGMCYKGLRCKFEHKPFRVGGVTTDTDDVHICPTATTSLGRFTGKLQVVFSHCSSPVQVYGQLEHEGNAYGSLLKELFNNMNRHEQIDKYEAFHIKPTVGEFIIARNVDDCWWRGLLIELNTSEDTKAPLANVFLVDIGGTIVVPCESIRKMSVGFTYLPFQAVRIRLHKIRASPNIDADKFALFIDEYLYRDMTINISFTGDGFVEGELETCSGVNLGAAMIQAGFAEMDNRCLNPLPSSNILVE